MMKEWTLQTCRIGWALRTLRLCETFRRIDVAKPSFGSMFNCKAARRAAFSLLEVLLATTVLIVIVMMVALIFQQSNNAWNAGTRRADSETTLRGIVGFIERDLTHAVDAAAFGWANDFSDPSGMTFLTLDGTNRVPLKVKYDFDGLQLSRTSTQLQAPTTPPPIPPYPYSPTVHWPVVGSAVLVPLNDASVNPLSSFVLSYSNAPPGSASTNLPLYVTVEVHMRPNKQSGLISGWSEGRNRPGHPEDRIQATQ